MEKAIEERVSKATIDRIAILAHSQAGVHFDKLKVDVIVQLDGEKHAYQATYKVSRDLLDPEAPVLDAFFDEMKKQFKRVLAGEETLNAVV